jgi:anti-sigma B factor antagonist
MSDVSLARLDGSLSLVRLRGEFDLSNTDPVIEKLNEAIDDPRSRAIAVDLSEVTFLDSKMLQVLVTARDRAQTVVKPVWLVRPEPTIWRVFQVTMLDKLFRDFESLSEVESHHRSLAGPLMDRG